MLKIGITGGIGSGKTTACRIFELLGIPVYYADEESKKILAEDKEVRKALLEQFGKEVLNEEGVPDRKKLAAIVFNDAEKLSHLNAILHPAVGAHFEKWIKQQKAPYVLKEAAILFESGAYRQLDKVITVSAPEELRIQRTMARDKVSREEVEGRMKRQLDDKERERRSDFSLLNDEQALLIPQLLEIHRLLTEHK